jgi:curved DNA-binding protein CbpA
LDSKGYYAILGVSENASFQELKRAYRGLARKYHPDRNNSSLAEDMIKKINASFEVLSDKDKRVEYDGIGIENEQFTNLDVSDSEENDIPMEQGQPSPTPHYYHESDTAKSSRDYKDTNNHYTVGGIYKNSHNIGKNVGMERAVSGIDKPAGRLHIIVEPSLCMAFGGCETLSPRVFVVEKNKMINPKARIASETDANLETILAAAQTCPTKAIKIMDRYTGEQLFP